MKSIELDKNRRKTGARHRAHHVGQIEQAERTLRFFPPMRANRKHRDGNRGAHARAPRNERDGEP